MKVQSPDATTWRVSRRWVPWRRRLKGKIDTVPDVPFGPADDPIGVVLWIVGLLFLIPFLILVVLVSIELLLVLAVLPFALLGRVLLGRRWTVEVRRGWRPWSEELAGDWGESGRRIESLAEEIRRGDVPPRTLDHTRT